MTRKQKDTRPAIQDNVPHLYAWLLWHWITQRKCNWQLLSGANLELHNPPERDLAASINLQFWHHPTEDDLDGYGLVLYFDVNGWIEVATENQWGVTNFRDFYAQQHTPKDVAAFLVEKTILKGRYTDTSKVPPGYRGYDGPAWYAEK